MGDSFYHIFTTNIPILYTLFFELLGVGIHNVISKNYHMSVITLISREICDKIKSYTKKEEGEKYNCSFGSLSTLMSFILLHTGKHCTECKRIIN
jgi:hypothetical protein